MKDKVRIKGIIINCPIMSLKAMFTRSCCIVSQALTTVLPSASQSSVRIEILATSLFQMRKLHIRKMK